jgi:hypothetical protein
MALAKLNPELNSKTVKITMLCRENCRINNIRMLVAVFQKNVEEVYCIPEV